MNEGQVIARLTEMKRALRNNSHVAMNASMEYHTCDRDGPCRPENEFMMYRRSAEQGCVWPGEPQTTHIYLCDYGKIHRCTPEHCDAYDVETGSSDVICNISGRVYGQCSDNYGSTRDEQDANAIGEPVIKQQRRHHQKGSGCGKNVPLRKHVQEKVRNIIYSLLYGNQRKHLIDSQVAACKAEREAVLARYRTECERKGVFPVLTEEVTLSTNALASRHVLEHLGAADSRRLAYYENIVMQVWEKSLELLVGMGPRGETTHPKPNVECVTLAVLYFMQTGYKPHGLEVLPYDEYLCRHLPRSSDLHAFGLDKRHDTMGTRMLTDMYDAVIQSNVNVARIYIRYDKEIGKETTTENGGETQNVQERLFMPTSRKRHLKHEVSSLSKR